jgi:hypothetical protein
MLTVECRLRKFGQESHIFFRCRESNVADVDCTVEEVNVGTGCRTVHITYMFLVSTTALPPCQRGVAEGGPLPPQECGSSDWRVWEPSTNCHQLCHCSPQDNQSKSGKKVWPLFVLSLITFHAVSTSRAEPTASYMSYEQPKTLTSFTARQPI